MINIAFDLKDKKAARIFGQAMLDYSGEADEAPFERVPPLGAPGREAVLTSETPVETAATPAKPSEPSAPIHGGGTGEPPAVDKNGVPFNAEFCSKAKVPFYASGKNKGQWKRKQKVDETAYDTWYAAEHIKAHTGPTAQIEPVAPDTAAAFGPPQSESPDDDAPQGAGELMKWVSEQMNAGNLAQSEVDSAYTTAGVTPAELFSGDADAVRRLYDVLVSVIAA